MNQVDRWKAYRQMADETHATLMSFVDTIIADNTLPTPAPPDDITDKLPWNDDSPWPFPTRGKSAPLTRVKYITLHHSAGNRDTTNIEYWNYLHSVTKRWPHIGYHFGIASRRPGDPIGLYQMNRIGEFTWHDSRNADTLAVCIAGDLRAEHDDAPTPEQVYLAGQLLAWLVPQLPNFVGVTFHKLIQATACPGDVERWGGEIVAATKTWGIDLSGRWGVKPMGVRARIMGALVRQPRAKDYEDVCEDVYNE